MTIWIAHLRRDVAILSLCPAAYRHVQYLKLRHDQDRYSVGDITAYRRSGINNCVWFYTSKVPGLQLKTRELTDDIFDTDTPVCAAAEKLLAFCLEGLTPRAKHN